MHDQRRKKRGRLRGRAHEVRSLTGAMRSEAHPEWAMRHLDGSVQYSGEEPLCLFKTCMFTSYMDDYISPSCAR